MSADVRPCAPAPRRRTGPVLLLLLVLVLAVSAALSQVWTRLKVLDYGYRISRASREHSRLAETNRKLRVELTMLKNPDRIKRIAQDRLGMALPAPAQIRRVRMPGTERVSTLAPVRRGANGS